MYLLPGIAGTLPDAGFFKRYGLRAGIPHALDESDVTDDGDISHDANMGLNHGHQAGAGTAAKLEIELMERHPFDQVATGFGLKGSESRVSQLLVDGPVVARDGFEQLLIEL